MLFSLSKSRNIQLRGNFTLELLRGHPAGRGLTPRISLSIKPSWLSPLSRFHLPGWRYSVWSAWVSAQVSVNSRSHLILLRLSDLIRRRARSRVIRCYHCKLILTNFRRLGELVTEIRKNDAKIRNGMSYLVIKNQLLASDRYFLAFDKNRFRQDDYPTSGKGSCVSANNGFLMVKRVFCLHPLKV